MNKKENGKDKTTKANKIKILHLSFSSIVLKITLEDNSVFAVLAVAEELGITHLKRTCHDNIDSTLSISNACGFYAAALQMEQELQYHGNNSDILTPYF